ncbi:MAG: tRNA pseudouridine(55) synthase TruB [Bacteroidota bacterium]|nr:tRNA pseudouridine(55) synthase TruB [Bacteroidota bacterium]
MKNFNFAEGEVLLIDKPYKWTSFDVISKLRSHIRGRLGLRKLKVGHAGTLDPLATGLVVVCTGKYTKRINEFQDAIKEYTGTICLGATTPSFDLEKEIDQRYDISHLNDQMIRDAALRFIGEMDQMPPQFSAKKINGKRAYEYARKDQEIELETRKITISEFEITGIHLPEIDFRIVCSKGTYIRAIARDFGEALNCGGHLTALRRTRNGQMNIEEAQTLDQVMNEITEWAAHERKNELFQK